MASLALVPVAYLLILPFGSLIQFQKRLPHLRLQRTGDTTIFSDTPEVDGHEECCDEWEEEYVQCIEANQGALADLMITDQQEVHFAADERRSKRDVGADGDGPE